MDKTLPPDAPALTLAQAIARINYLRPLVQQLSPNLVFEVLGGRRKPTRGQTHNIAVRLGLKTGEIVTDVKGAV